MDWSFIKQFHRNPPTIQLKRHPTIEESYQKSKENGSKDYEGKLYNRIFGNVETDWALTPNDYPYNFSDGTQHYLLWFKGDVDYSLLEKRVEDLECIYFENLDSNKSIKSIRHVHLFIYPIPPVI